MTHQDLQQGGPIDLNAVDAELRQQDAYRREGHTARTLLRAPDLRVVLIVMKAGSRIAEHRANESASVLVLTGHVRLHLAEGLAELYPGQLLLIEQGIKHDVEALADSTLVLTLGWRGKD